MLGAYHSDVCFVGVAVSWPHAYLAVGGAGLSVVDISDPSAPRQVGALALRGYADDVIVVGSRAYVLGQEYLAGAAGQGATGILIGLLHIVDVADPAQPARLGEFSVLRPLLDVAVVEPFVYLASWFQGLVILDASDPAHPTRVGSAGWASATAVAVAGNTAYLGDVNGALSIIDITNPASPLRLGYRIMSSAISDLASANGYVYVADRWFLEVVDASIPVQPRVVGGLLGLAGACAVVPTHPDICLVAGEMNAAIVEASDATHPRQIAQWYTHAAIRDAAIAEGRAYLVGDALSVGLAPSTAAGGRLQILNVADPARPNYLGGCALSGMAQAVAVSQTVGYTPTVAYVAIGPSGVSIVDASDPAHPYEVGVYDTAAYAWDVAIAGPCLYVANGQAGLSVLDISNPVAPRPLGEWRVLSDVERVVLAGRYAYVGSDTALYVVDISDPAAPVQVGVWNALGQIQDLAVEGGHAWLALGMLGVAAVDVSAPQQPLQVGIYPMFDQAMAIAALAEPGSPAFRVYVAADDGGLAILTADLTGRRIFLPILLR